MKFPLDTPPAVDRFLSNLRKSLLTAIAERRPAELDQNFSGIPVKDAQGNTVDYIVADHIMAVRFPPKEQFPGEAGKSGHRNNFETPDQTT